MPSMTSWSQGGRTAPSEIVFLYFRILVFSISLLLYIYITQGFLPLFIIMFFLSKSIFIHTIHYLTYIYPILLLLIISTIYEIVLGPCGGIFLEV